MHMLRLTLVSLLFSLIFSVSAFAQKINPTGNSVFDSLILRAVELRYANIDEAFLTLDQTQKIRDLNTLQHAMIANQLGALNYIKGDYTVSLKEYSKAYKLLENENDIHQQVFALNGRGLIYLSQHSYQQAADFFQKCIDINLKLEDSTALGANYLNKGIALSDLGKKEDAMRELEKGLAITENFPEIPSRWMNFNRQAQIKLELGQLEEAKKLFNKVMAENPNLKTWEKTFSHTGLGWIALQENNPKLALYHGKKALDFALEIKAFWDIERATRLIAESLEKLGDYQQALNYAKLNKSYSDSLYNQNKNSEISYLQLQLSEADNEVLEQEKRLIEQAALFSQKTSLGLGIALLTMMGALFFYRKNVREKERLNLLLIEQKEEILQQNNTLKKLNDEKNKLFSVLTHDLKSPINSIKQLLELLNLEILSEKEKIEIIQLLQKQVKQTDQMMDELLHWSLAQMDGIVTNRTPLELNELISHTIANQEFPAEKKGIRFEFEPADKNLKILVDRTQFKIILQNCLQNAIKFSHQGSTIQLSVEERNSIVLVKIRDFGVGISQKKINEILNNQTTISSTEGTTEEKGTGLGLLLAKQFLARNEGSLTLKSEVGKGTEVVLSFEKHSDDSLDINNELVNGSEVVLS